MRASLKIVGWLGRRHYDEMSHVGHTQGRASEFKFEFPVQGSSLGPINTQTSGSSSSSSSERSQSASEFYSRRFLAISLGFLPKSSRSLSPSKFFILCAAFHGFISSFFAFLGLEQPSSSLAVRHRRNWSFPMNAPAISGMNWLMLAVFGPALFSACAVRGIRAVLPRPPSRL